MIKNVNMIYQEKVNMINNRMHGKISAISDNFKTCFDKALESYETQDPIQNITVSTNYSTAYNSSNTSNNFKKTDYDDIIKEKASKYGVDENLIKAVIQTESGFNPNAVSSCGAQGLMQLMPATAAGLGVTNSFDAEQNIDGGVKYLKGQIERFGGNVKLALAAYNCGPYRVSSLGLTNLDDPTQLAKLPLETQNYVKKITSYMN